MRVRDVGVVFALVTAFARAGTAQPAPSLAYVPRDGTNLISVIDVSTNSVIATIPVGTTAFGGGTSTLPDGVAVSADGTRVYVTKYLDDTVSIIDALTKSVVATVVVGPTPAGVALSPDGRRLYVANAGNTLAPEPNRNTVSVIDTETAVVVDTIPVGAGPSSIAVTPDGRFVYVANAFDATVSMIDTNSDTVTVALRGLGFASGIALTPDGTLAYVSGTGSVVVMETSHNTVVARIPVGCAPRGIAVRPDGARVYVANFCDGTVSVIDTATNTVAATVAVDFGSMGVAVTHDGGQVYVTDPHRLVMLVIDTATNMVVSAISTGLTGAFGSFFGPAPLAPTSTLLSAAPNPGVAGEPVSLQASVSSTTAVATGTIEFRDGLTILGATALDNGLAALTTSALAVGSHDLTARFVPTGLFAESSSGVVIETIYRANTAPTNTGSNVAVTPTATLPDGSTSSVSLSFGTVTSGGTTTVTTSSSGPPPPTGFKLGQPPIYYDVSTTATFSGAVQLCFGWQEGQLHNENNAKLLHYESGAWHDVTVSVDTQANVICGRVTSLSPFAITEIAYTFGGFEQPLLTNGSASIQQPKAGRTIPVKFQLRSQGQPTNAATATIAVFKIVNAATGTVDTTNLTQDAGASADSGNQFRYDATSQQYAFNLSTKGWLAPATYRIYVTLSDGSVYSVDFSLR